MQKPCSGKFKTPCPWSHSSSNTKSEFPPRTPNGHACPCLHSTTLPSTRTGKPYVGDGSKQEKCMFTWFPVPIRWQESVYTRKRDILLKALTKCHLSRYYWITHIKTYIPFDLTWDDTREDKHLSPPGGQNWQLLLTSVNKWLRRKCFPNTDTK